MNMDEQDGPLTPTLSPAYRGEGAGMPPLPLAGEGWGEGASRSQDHRLTFIANEEIASLHERRVPPGAWPLSVEHRRGGLTAHTTPRSIAASSGARRYGPGLHDPARPPFRLD